MMKMHERYQGDPKFRNVVDMIQSVIEDAQFTPTEIREAAMLAQIMYESRHVRPTIFTKDDVLNGRV